jgi:DNA-binding NtrC family response regulator
MPRRRTPRSLGLARVLLVHGELAPRLALQTILEAAGYTVEVAASPAEAMIKLDDGLFELVLTDQKFRQDVLAYARVKAYRPATGVVNSSELLTKDSVERVVSRMSVHTEGVPGLLEDVAERIGARARRRYRPLRAAV